MIRKIAMIGWMAIAVALGGGLAHAQSADAFFDASTLHEVRLFIHSDDWRRLQENYQENFYYPADVTWRGTTTRNVGIRSRGKGSRSDRKPGLRVDLDRYVTDQRLFGLKSFVLDNVLQDEALVKERLTLALFTKLGMAAPRATHTRLYINNEFWGVYALVESVDKDFIERVYSTIDGRKEREGVLFEYKWHYPFYLSYLGPELHKYQQLFEPKTQEQEPMETLYGPLRDLCRLVSEASDADFVGVLSAYLDVEQAIRYMAIDNFIAEFDGILGAWGMNNFYVYRFHGSAVTQLIPWDKDNTFRSATHSIWFNVEENVLIRRALGVPRLRSLYLDTLLEAARAASEAAPGDARGWLERELDRSIQQIQAAVEEDRVKPQTNDAFRNEVSRMREFARTRSAFVQCEVAVARGAASAGCPTAAGGPAASRRVGG